MAKLDTELDITIFSTRIMVGKAFTAKQKIREFEKLLLKSKRIQKRLGK